VLDGTTLRAVIRNTNTRSQDYGNLIDVPRPSHADYTAQVKYGGTLNMAGGGPFSGRMTAPLCILGGICLQLLARRGITIGAQIVRIGNVTAPGYDPVRVTADELTAAGRAEFPAASSAQAAMQAEIASARSASDSVGGVVECAALGLPVGLGGPMSDGLESRISAIVFGIPAVRGVEFGAGFAAAAMRGSEHNDPFCIENGQVRTQTNRHGGVLGGISSGMPLMFRTAFKPTPSIGIEQQSVSLSQKAPAPLTIVGRHDPCIVPRAVPVVEAACAIAITDAMLESNLL
jgi:chorismate synthase